MSATDKKYKVIRKYSKRLAVSYHDAAMFQISSDYLEYFGNYR